MNEQAITIEYHRTDCVGGIVHHNFQMADSTPRPLRREARGIAKEQMKAFAAEHGLPLDVMMSGTGWTLVQGRTLPPCTCG